MSAALSSAPRTLGDMIRFVAAEAHRGILPDQTVLEIMARAADDMEAARQTVPDLLPENVIPFRRRRA